MGSSISRNLQRRTDETRPGRIVTDYGRTLMKVSTPSALDSESKSNITKMMRDSTGLIFSPDTACSALPVSRSYPNTTGNVHKRFLPLQCAQGRLPAIAWSLAFAVWRLGQGRPSRCLSKRQKSDKRRRT
eukprot:m.251007 g.251007  ORF g.251007 m.251007 type:complete len:130 (+) comp15893_c0_seq3:1063-1452(+)